jgi:hypothetical protein
VKKARLWVVEYSVNRGKWHLSIHDFGWFRVAKTRAEADSYASLARRWASPSWRYRVVPYERVEPKRRKR